MWSPAIHVPCHSSETYSMRKGTRNELMPNAAAPRASSSSGLAREYSGMATPVAELPLPKLAASKPAGAPNPPLY